MTDQPNPAPADLRDLYAAAIASYDHAVGHATNPAPGGHHHGQADAALAVRDGELEQLQQMYAQQSAANAAYRLQIDELISRNAEYADRAIENGQRAGQAEDLLRVAHDTSNRSEAARASAVRRADQAEAALERVRKLAERWENALAPDLAYARALRAAINPQEQP